MRTYTDGTLLVRADTGKRLHGRDVDPAAPEVSFVAWDLGRSAPIVVGTDRLGFAPTDQPALDGTFQVALADGTTVAATPGMGLVRQELDQWTPERAAELTAVPAERIVAHSRRPSRRRSSWLGTTTRPDRPCSRCCPR